MPFKDYQKRLEYQREYQRRKYGYKALRTLEERFWSKVNKNGPIPNIIGWTKGRCWLWIAGSRPIGYGIFAVNGKNIGPYRFSWQLRNGDFPPGLEPDHLCRNVKCVNPEHIEPVTHKENVLRGISPPAIHARKTHCARGGHELTGDNLYVNPRGQRECMECRRRARRESWARCRQSIS